MSATVLRQIFQTPDGATFDNKADAERHMRKPSIMAALLAVAGGQRELAESLYAKEDELRDALDAGTIRRVSKAERNALVKALDAIAKSTDPAFRFVVDNKDAIADSFRWPTQQRLSAEDKVAAQATAVADIFDGREDVAGWVLQEKDKILQAYNAGKPERAVSAAASEGLAAYQAMKAAEKVVQAATAAFEESATAENKAALDAAIADHAAKKKAVDDRKAAREAANNK